MSELDNFIAATRAKPPRKAPYTFVHTEQKILASPVENLDLSLPVKDAVSGCLSVEWKNDTPMLVGGGNIMEDHPDNLTPFKIGDKYGLPGSTIKGLIRATMEIASFARLSFIGNFTGHTHNYEDLTWQHEINLKRGDMHNGGWLFKTADGYKFVQASDTPPIKIEDFVGRLGVNVETWHKSNMHSRLTLLQANNLNGKRSLSVFSDPQDGQHIEAQLVVSGATPDELIDIENPKNREYLFFWPEVPKEINIDKATGDRFLASLNRDSNAHAGDPEANYDALITTGGIAGLNDEEPRCIKQQLKDPNTYGLPVFWRNPCGGSQTNCKSSPVLSLTALYRVPYKKTVHDVINQTQLKLPDDQLDFVQALLGWAPPEPPTGRIAERQKIEKSLRSRVRFGFATCNNARIESAPKIWAATQPKPSYWPYYLKAKSPKATHPVDYNNPQAILAGRKRYPARGSTTNLPGGGQNQQTLEHRGDMEQSITFLKPGATFTSEIRFRNISPIELGALVWAISFGDLEGEGGFRHMLGRAKSYGYGQVQARIVADKITSHTDDKLDMQGALEKFTTWAAEELGTSFDEHPTIRQLKGAAHAATGSTLINHLNFPGGEGQDVLDAYTKIKQRAQKSSGVGGDTIAKSEEVALPPYPGVPKL